MAVPKQPKQAPGTKRVTRPPIAPKPISGPGSKTGTGRASKPKK